MRYIVIALPEDNNGHDDLLDLSDVGDELYDGAQSSEEAAHETPPFTTLEEGDVGGFINFTSQYDAS